MAVIQEVAPDKLILRRAQNSGKLTVTVKVSNGGEPATASATIEVTEPAEDAWVRREPAEDEMPVDGQFYARNDKNEGTLYCNGILDPLLLRMPGECGGADSGGSVRYDYQLVALGQLALFGKVRRADPSNN